MLYQLSYEPQTAGAVGLEPTTFEVEARHSIQLSYTPVLFVNTPGRMGGEKPGCFAKILRCSRTQGKKPGFFDLCVQD